MTTQFLSVLATWAWLRQNHDDPAYHAFDRQPKLLGWCGFTGQPVYDDAPKCNCGRHEESRVPRGAARAEWKALVGRAEG